jgi:hypothetical protein
MVIITIQRMIDIRFGIDIVVGYIVSNQLFIFTSIENIKFEKKYSYRR